MRFKRIILEVSELFHADIKTRAAKERTTIKQYVIAALVRQMSEQNK